MKKITILVMLVALPGLLGYNLPVPSLDIQFVKASTVSKTSKKSKKSSSSQCRDTKCRLKRLRQLGINRPKNYLNYGKDLSLNEMGAIIGRWIKAGHFEEALKSNTQDWLVLYKDGKCVHGPCDRWQ